MRTAAFLAARELRRRWGRAVLAAAVVAGAVALSVGLELLGRARERAVEAELDGAGPALRVLPRGASAADAAALRYGSAALPAAAAARARAALGGDVRAIESRAVVRDPENGVAVVVVEPGSRAARGVGAGRVVLGEGLAGRWSKRAGDVVRVLGRSFQVAEVAPSSADGSDYAVLALSSDVGAPLANELRVYLEAGVPPAQAERALRAALADAAVVRSDRGEVADGGLQGSIASHRRAVQLVTAIVAALALLVATHLDVSERRRELALLAAIGLRRAGLAALVVLRASASAIVGAVAGVVGAVALAASQPEFVPATVPGLAAVAVLLSVATAAIAAAPLAFSAAGSDPVAELQES